MARPPALVVGTAGHIDHGKSRLVLTLTGTDPDRLPEEQARGMTIDLGFAHTRIDDCDIWFVDMPGHERFLRNMLAGATGVDVTLLVVAADDSVMPQTREHAEVLSLLGVERCTVVLTKMDLVDDEWADQVEIEVRQMLAGFGMEVAHVLRTSAQSGRGMDELRKLLVRLAREHSQHAAGPRWFCLPIDRAFTVPGRGTVVTGSVLHGAVAREDELELWPSGQRVRVRDLQSHHDQYEAVAGRMRLAINLAGVSHEEVHRGCTLATVGYLQPTRYVDVWLPWLRRPGKAVRQMLRLRLHIATTEVLAELRLPDKASDDAIREQFAQIKVAEPIVATWGQRFILRDEAGTRTLGGGRVLRPVSRLWTARRPAPRPSLQALLDGPPAERLEEVIRLAEWQPLSEPALSARAGLENAQAAGSAAKRLVETGRVQVLEGAAMRLLLHQSHLKELGEDLVRRITKFAQDNPRQPGLPRSQWPGWMPGACPAKLRPDLADWFLKSGLVRLDGDFIQPAGEAQSMSADDQALLDRILAEFNEGAFQPPELSALRCRTSRNDKRVRELIDLAAARGQLVRIASGLWLHRARWDDMTRRLADALRQQGKVTVSDIRTMLNSTRKFVVPIVERLDASGITRRDGDYRTLGPNAPPAA